jgi:excisionase family DNA binding protein
MEVRVLTVIEAAHHLGVSVRQMQRIIAERRVPFHRISPRITRLRVDELDAYLAACRVHDAAK